MKLATLLAFRMKRWPIGAQTVRQDCMGVMITNNGTPLFKAQEIAEDWITAHVTLDEWASERDRVQPMDSEQRAKDQALWDLVASSRFCELRSIRYAFNASINEAFDDADAFMAERAKRMKQ